MTKNKPMTVQLFATCLIDAFAPDTGMATVDLLEANGCRVEFPFEQTCCGQPAFNGGFWDEARGMARHTLDVLDPTRGPIIVPAASCADMMIHHYPELFANDADYAAKAERVSARTRELTQFLVDDLGVTDTHAHTDGKITYHASCHGLRNLNIYEQPKSLLEKVDGAEVVPLEGETECCGFGGLFAVKMSDISGEMLKTKLDNIEASGADTVVATDFSCLMHIGGGLQKRGSHIKAKHIAEVLRPAKSEDDYA